MTDFCKAVVFQKWHEYPCTRKAVKDGYCKQHHPDAEKARREASLQKFQREDAIRDAERIVEVLGRQVTAAAKAWRASKDLSSGDLMVGLVAAVDRLRAAEANLAAQKERA